MAPLRRTWSRLPAVLAGVCVLATVLRVSSQALSLTPLDVICQEDSLQTFCAAVRTARDGLQDPIALLVDSRTSILSIFLPTDRGLNNTRRVMQRAQGVASAAALLADPLQAARFVKAHVVAGPVPDSTAWRAGDAWTSVLPSNITVKEGHKGSVFLQGPRTVSRLLSGRNVVGGLALSSVAKTRMHIIEVPLYA